MALSNTQKSDSIKHDARTAYRSTLFDVSVSPYGLPYLHGVYGNGISREALLDFALDAWDDIGNDLLLVSAQKDAVEPPKSKPTKASPRPENHDVMVHKM